MKKTRFDRWPCSLARTADLVGDAWTLLILREAFYGVSRFDRFEAELGIGRNILSRRLDRMVKERLLERVPYRSRPTRHEYRLLPRGRALFPALMALVRWGDEWLAGEEGPPVALLHRRTGRPVRPRVVDEESGAPLELEDVRAVPGPGFPAALLRSDATRRRFRLSPVRPGRAVYPA